MKLPKPPSDDDDSFDIAIPVPSSDEIAEMSEEEFWSTIPPLQDYLFKRH